MTTIAEHDQKIKEILAVVQAAAPVGSCEVRLHQLDLPYCPEKLFRNTAKCFWHSDDLSKYEPAAVEEYFGQGFTLARAIEEAVARRVNLQDAVFENARFGGDFLRRGPKLAGAYLVSANFRGARLSYSDLNGAVLASADLRNATLSECDLRNANLSNARLFDVKLRGNSLEGVKGLKRRNFRGRKGRYPIDRMLETYPDQAEPMYRELTKYFSNQALYDDASWAAYKATQMRHLLLRRRISFEQIRLETMMSEHSSFFLPMGSARIEWVLACWEWAKSGLLLAVTGYGERPGRVILSSTVLILVFAAIYCLPGSRTVADFPSSLYFSMTTFSTLGYGDIAPTPYFRFVAAFEALLGVLMTGLFLFCLSRRSVTRA